MDTIVIPVAGLGIRLLPLTKSVPKGLIPVGGKPVIQHVVDEALEAGIEKFVFVVGHDQSIYRDYFSTKGRMWKWLDVLGRNSDRSGLEESHRIPPCCEFVEQVEPLGLGHALRIAAKQLSNDPFMVAIPDTVFPSFNTTNRIIDSFNKTGTTTISLGKCKEKEVEKYGIVDLGSIDNDEIFINNFVEKPSVQDAPSCFYFNGRCVLKPDELFPTSVKGAQDNRMNIDLAETLGALARSGKVRGTFVDAPVFDCGSFEGLELCGEYFRSRSEARKQLRQVSL